MENTLTLEPHLSNARDWFSHGDSQDTILEKLQKLGLDEPTREVIMKEMSSLFLEKKRQNGIRMIIIGALFLVVGFFLTVFLFHANQSIDFVMYGMTTVGASLLLYGLVNVLGW
jgi:predicted phage tail protein